MLIDFDHIDEEVLPHFKGGEKATAARMVDDGLNRIMQGRLVPGASIGLHSHDTSSEIIFIVAGEGHVLYDDERLSVRAGMCHYRHSLINDSEADLEFWAVVPQQ